MAKLRIYSFYDEAAGAYTNPFFLPNDGLAIRAFANNVNDPSGTNNIATNPEQFTLFCIGEFDDISGEIVVERQRNLGHGLVYKEPSKSVEDIVALMRSVERVQKTLDKLMRMDEELPTDISLVKPQAS